MLCCLAGAELWGCTNSYELHRGSAEGLSSNLRKLQGETVDLELTRGVTDEQVTVTFIGDSVGFRKGEPPLSGVVSLDSVVSITRRGSLVAPIVGGVGGALLGAVIGAAVAAQPNDQSGNLDRWDHRGVCGVGDRCRSVER